LSTDAYVRVGPITTKAFLPEEEREGVVFVDVSPGGAVADLRAAGHRCLESASAIVVREAQTDSEETLGALRRVRDRLKTGATVGVLEQPLAEEPRIRWDVPDTHEETAEVIERCRSIEVRALATWGRAIWRSGDFHYRLPSGEHARAFVRVGDAIRNTRDAEVLASWLYSEAVDGVGIVHDTGTISAVVVSLIGAMRANGLEPSLVICLDGYPRTDLAVSAAFQQAAEEGSKVLALLSVNSSGRVLDRLAAAGRDLGHGSCSIHVVIDRQPNAQFPLSYGKHVRITRWHPGPRDTPLVEPPGPAGRCPLCEDFNTARLVPIDGHTFDGRLRASVRRIVPSINDANANRSLWEHVDRLRALKLQAAPDPAVEKHRPPRDRMPISFANDVLLQDVEWRKSVAAKFVETGVGKNQPAADLVIIPEHELSMEGMESLLEDLSPSFGGGVPDVIGFGEDGLPRENKAVVENANAIIALTLGTVTGTTLQRMLVAVQSARPGGGYSLRAMICHARPSERRAWETLQNSWARRVFAAWQSYVPDGKSPLIDERETLQEFPRDPTASYDSFLDARLKYCDQPDPETPLFWGAATDATVTPNSIFGQGIGQTAVYTAVATAMERARKETPQMLAPEDRVFEIPAMLRSYYDPLIIVAMLRWLKPHEVWWGWDENTADEVVAAVLERAPAEASQRASYLGILLPELLLAGAQGKLPSSALEIVRVRAEATAAALLGNAAAALALGLALVKRHEWESPSSVSSPSTHA